MPVCVRHVKVQADMPLHDWSCSGIYRVQKFELGGRSMVRLKCYHGTTRENAHSILKDGRFLPSETRDSLRLGKGAYFYCKTGMSDYAKTCAYETAKYHHEKSETGSYGIVSCTIECEDTQFFDMCRPDFAEQFHKARHALYQKMTKEGHVYSHCGELDTQTMDMIRSIRDIAIIRSPEFFGFMSFENQIKFKKRPKPLTYVPNVIIVCADTDKAKISDIKIEEEGEFDV